MNFFVRNAVIVSSLMVLVGCEGVARKAVVRQIQFGDYQEDQAAQTPPCESQEGEQVRLILALNSARLTSDAIAGRASWGPAERARADELQFLSAYSECREASSRDLDQASAKLRSKIQQVLREALRANDPIDIQFDSEIARHYSHLLGRVSDAIQSHPENHRNIERLLDEARRYVHEASESSIECRVQAKKNERLENCEPSTFDLGQE